MDALIIVDIQNDFCPGGKLAVDEGDQIVPVVNQLADRFDIVVLTQDWHPQEHSSFASNHDGSDAYQVVKMPYGDQVLWPDHCVQGTEGAKFHKDLEVDKGHLIIRKGYRENIDSYSAFLENDHETTTGLDGWLKSMGVDHVYVCGLATDFCVKWTAIDATKFGYDATVIIDATKAIDLNNSREMAIEEMENAGVILVDSDVILNYD